MFQPDDVLSYMEMCSTIGVNLQRGMNFRLRNAGSIILMSLRSGTPYADQVEDDGRTLIYEGHDIPKTINGRNPKDLNQSDRHRGGSLTRNGLFAEAPMRSTSNRPGLDELLKDCRRRTIDVVVVWKFDRFARSLKNLIAGLELCRALVLTLYR